MRTPIIGKIMVDRVPQFHNGRVKFLGRIVSQDGHELFHGRTYDTQLEARKNCQKAALDQSINLSGQR